MIPIQCIFAEIKLEELEYIKDKVFSKLGYLCSDIDHEGIIISEKNLAPKTYKYKYINSKNEIGEMNKCKGIPKKCLRSEYYDLDEPVEVEFDGLKKKHKTLTKKDKEQGLVNFSIVNNHQKRTMNKSVWQGMQLKDNEFFPHGYVV